MSLSILLEGMVPSDDPHSFGKPFQKPPLPKDIGDHYDYVPLSNEEMNYMELNLKESGQLSSQTHLELARVHVRSLARGVCGPALEK